MDTGSQWLGEMGELTDTDRAWETRGKIHVRKLREKKNWFQKTR